MARKPMMSGWCRHPSKTDGVDSHERCEGGNTSNPQEEWQACPCVCHLGDVYECGNCGRDIAEAPLWEEGEDMTYVHFKDGVASGEDCPPGTVAKAVEAERHPDYCTFAGQTYDETNGQPSNCLCPPEGGWPEPEEISIEIDAPSKPKKKGKKKKKDKKKS